MIFQHFRHATSHLRINGKTLLIDPVLADKGSYPPVLLTKNRVKNPLTDLPSPREIILKADGVLVTHNHFDHFDKVAAALLPKNIALLCQDDDAESLKSAGFTNVTGISETTKWLDFSITRYTGTHGGRFLKKKLGVSSSYLFQLGVQKVYFTGDTLLTKKVQKNLKHINPTLIIANGGGARLLGCGKITMEGKDIEKMACLLPDTRIIAVHMDSLNHCFDTREKLKQTVSESNRNILIPRDGEVVRLSVT